MMTPADIEAERPGPPPSTSSQQMVKDEVAEVKADRGASITSAQLAIAQKWNDGAGTLFAAGTLERHRPGVCRGTRNERGRAAGCSRCLNMAMHDAGVGCWEAKYFYFNPRPSQMIRASRPRSNPEFSVPYLRPFHVFARPPFCRICFPVARRASRRDEAGISRLHGGIHYRSDIEAGKAHGNRIAAYTLTFAHAMALPDARFEDRATSCQPATPHAWYRGTMSSTPD
jgi:hypothetical protein